MSQPGADRNLLFGVLALQMDFIKREQLITAMQAWVFDKSKPLGAILCAQKVLDEDSRTLLEALVQKREIRRNLCITCSRDVLHTSCRTNHITGRGPVM